MKTFRDDSKRTVLIFRDKKTNKIRNVYSGGLLCPYCHTYGASIIIKKINQVKFKCRCLICRNTVLVIIKDPYQLCFCCDIPNRPMAYCQYCFNGRVVDFIESIRGIAGNITKRS